MLGAFAARQVKTIIGAALFEGAAFLSLVGYMISAELVHTAVAAVCVVGILAHFPIAGRVEEQVEAELRRRREERNLA